MSAEDRVSTSQPDDRLEGWGEIAKHLGRSVSTAQRREKKEGLPVYRHPHEKSDSVYAFKHEVDAWRTARRLSSSKVDDSPLTPVGDPVNPTEPEPIVSVVIQDQQSRYSSPMLWLGVLLIPLSMLAAGLVSGSYRFAILAFGLSSLFVILSYPYARDSVFARGAMALFWLAAISFVPSAWTLCDVMDTVVNIEVLRPAVVYPFVTGLKFLPHFVLLIAFWVILRRHGDVGFFTLPKLGTAYLLLGTVFLLMTCAAIVRYSGDYRIWQEELPGRWTIAVGYTVVFAINVALWLWGFQFLNRRRITSYLPLFSRFGLAYLLLLPAAVLVGHEYNRINLHYLDIRRPAPYRVTTPDAVRDLRKSLENDPQIGPALANLLKSPEFERALREKKFYKQDFDESLKLFRPAVIYGYQLDRTSLLEEPTFVTIRLPEKLASALGFRLDQSNQTATR